MRLGQAVDSPQSHGESHLAAACGGAPRPGILGPKVAIQMAHGGGGPMKRKIAAILAADVAGYSRLVAENEEETLTRLGAFRQVFDDFVGRFGGRIFNTAGDSVMCEFDSAVEAVRCAIDIQESLRTRNRDY